MGIILPFRQLEGRRVDAAAFVGLRTAEIVIFPGVRIERWDDDQPPRQAYRTAGSDDETYADPELTA